LRSLTNAFLDLCDARSTRIWRSGGLISDRSVCGSCSNGAKRTRGGVFQADYSAISTRNFTYAFEYHHPTAQQLVRMNPNEWLFGVVSEDVSPTEG
jgi:hypothetical protein